MLRFFVNIFPGYTGFHVSNLPCLCFQIPWTTQYRSWPIVSSTHPKWIDRVPSAACVFPSCDSGQCWRAPLVTWSPCRQPVEDTVVGDTGGLLTVPERRRRARLAWGTTYRHCHQTHPQPRGNRRRRVRPVVAAVSFGGAHSTTFPMAILGLTASGRAIFSRPAGAH